jgi:hypothetical protein
LTGEIEFYEPLEPIQPPPTKFEFFKQSTEHKNQTQYDNNPVSQILEPSRQNHQISKTHNQKNLS